MTASRTRFMTPVFRGARFENQEVPVDVLPDLAAYRDLVVELARHLFLARSPTRQRAPRGFADSFQLVLRKIEKGSACPVLERVVPASQEAMPPLFPAADLFEEARGLINDVLAAAAHRQRLPAGFPDELLPRFNQLGRGLRQDEWVEFRAPDRSSGPRFDREVRKWLVLRKEARYEDNAEIVGELRGGHIDREVLNVRLDNDREVEVRCPSAMVDEYLPARGKRVRIVGWGSYDRDDRLERVLRVDDIAILDEDDDIALPASIDAQFERLRALEPGWYEPDTPAPSQEALERVRQFLHAALGDPGLPRPYLYPTPDCGVSAEWSFPDWEVSATFDPDGERADLHATHLRSAASSAEELTLSGEDAATAFARFVSSFLPRAASAS